MTDTTEKMYFMFAGRPSNEMTREELIGVILWMMAYPAYHSTMSDQKEREDAYREFMRDMGERERA